MQALADSEHLQEVLLSSQIFPLDGSEQEVKFSEHRHSLAVGLQNEPVFLPWHELIEPHRQIPSMHLSPATLHVEEFWPPHSISKYKDRIMLCFKLTANEIFISRDILMLIHQTNLFLSKWYYYSNEYHRISHNVLWY